MRKRSRMLLIFLGICAVGSILFYVFFPREPSFKNRSLSEWIWIMHDKQPGWEKDQASAIVSQLGSNSIPLLLRWIKEPDRPSLTERVNELKSKIITWFITHHIIKPISITTYGGHLNQRTTAVLALAALDTTSRRAVIPALIQMFQDTNHAPQEMSEAAGAAFWALSALSPGINWPVGKYAYEYGFANLWCCGRYVGKDRHKCDRGRSNS